MYKLREIATGKYVHQRFNTFSNKGHIFGTLRTIDRKIEDLINYDGYTRDQLEVVEFELVETNIIQP